MVETSGNTEGSLLTTTGYRQVVVLAQAKLGDGINPISIVVILFVFRISRVIVQLRNIRRLVTLLRIEVTFLQQHGVVIAIQQLVALRLMSTRETERVSELRFSTRTTLGGNLDDTVGTLRTIDGCGSSILQHGDAGNIFRVDIKQLRELLIVGILHIKVAHIHIPGVAVHHNQRIAAGQ